MVFYKWCSFMVNYVWIAYVNVYTWSLTYGSYDGLLVMLKNDVDVCMDVI